MKNILSLFLCLIAYTSSATTSENLRIATYNSKFLSACMNKIRVLNYEKVVEALRADVVALQEVRDRLAVERFFSPDEWIVILDDDSTDDMNLAFAIRKGGPYRLHSGNSTNADEVKDFAIGRNNNNFVDERRALKLYITYQGHEVLLLNHHAKSRYNGRALTDEQRTLAALDLIAVISNASTPYVALLGDFNDTPDDASLNTMESGQLSIAEAENSVGGFLVILTEPLLYEQHVSYGLKSTDTTATIIKMLDTAIEHSRQTNFDNFESDTPVSKALYDQILITPSLARLISSGGKVRVFDDRSGVIGNNDTRASDHVPVFLDFNHPYVDTPTLKNSSLLPNPIGSDIGNETITIFNAGESFEGQVIIQDLSQKTKSWIFR